MTLLAAYSRRAEGSWQVVVFARSTLRGTAIVVAIAVGPWWYVQRAYLLARCLLSLNSE